MDASPAFVRVYRALGVDVQEFSGAADGSWSYTFWMGGAPPDRLLPGARRFRIRAASRLDDDEIEIVVRQTLGECKL